MSKESKIPVPMDPSITENRTPVAKENRSRACYAIKTLCEEVWVLFPETPVEYSNYTGRNVALDVRFDLTALDAGDAYDFTALLNLLNNADKRVDFVRVQEGAVLVSMWANARTQDSRETFNLGNAYLALAESESDKIWDGGDALIVDDDNTLDGGGA